MILWKVALFVGFLICNIYVIYGTNVCLKEQQDIPHKFLSFSKTEIGEEKQIKLELAKEKVKVQFKI